MGKKFEVTIQSWPVVERIIIVEAKDYDMAGHAAQQYSENNLPKLEIGHQSKFITYPWKLQEITDASIRVTSCQEILPEIKADIIIQEK